MQSAFAAALHRRKAAIARIFFIVQWYCVFYINSKVTLVISGRILYAKVKQTIKVVFMPMESKDAGRNIGEFKTGGTYKRDVRKFGRNKANRIAAAAGFSAARKNKRKSRRER